jgi:hypothetical protein
MGCYFDNEKINKSIQISELFTFQMSEAAACSRITVNQNSRSRYLDLKVQGGHKQQ